MSLASRRSLTLALSFAALLSAGCSTTRRTYTGSPRSADTIATVSSERNDWFVQIAVESVDGEPINGMHRDVIELLPGQHTLGILLELVPPRPGQGGDIHDFVSNPAVTDEREIEARLDARAGASYRLIVTVEAGKPLFRILDAGNRDVIVEVPIPK